MRGIQFAYDEPAAVVKNERKRYLVVGDLHIGRELKLAARGIRVYGYSLKMAERIASLMKEFKADGLVILGDVKESIPRPEAVEARLISSFFDRLSKYEITLIQGNHDAGLGDIPRLVKVKELQLGKIGLIHGNALPSLELMKCDFLIAGHDHPAARSGENLEKVWVMSNINLKEAVKSYRSPNRKAKLILAPAFSDLLLGTDIISGRMLNPLIRRGIFEMKGAKAYGLDGALVPVPLG